MQTLWKSNCVFPHDDVFTGRLENPRREWLLPVGKVLPDFLFFWYCLRSAACFLKRWEVLSYGAEIVETRERNPNRRQYMVHVYFSVCNPWNAKESSRDRLCQLAPGLLPCSVDKSCPMKQLLCERALEQERCFPPKHNCTKFLLSRHCFNSRHARLVRTESSKVGWRQGELAVQDPAVGMVHTNTSKPAVLSLRYDPSKKLSE